MNDESCEFHLSVANHTAHAAFKLSNFLACCPASTTCTTVTNSSPKDQNSAEGGRDDMGAYQVARSSCSPSSPFTTPDLISICSSCAVYSW